MTGVSTLGQSLSLITRIKDQQDRFSLLSTQLSTGKKTTRFSGLGTSNLASQRARADVKSLDTYVNNTILANRRIDLMLNAIEEIKAQADKIQDALLTFSQESLHQKGDTIFDRTSVSSTIDLSGTTLGALIAGSSPTLDPPNDQFEITFDIPDSGSQTITIDISDAAAQPGNAQQQLIAEINAQITAAGIGAPSQFDAVAQPGSDPGTVEILGQGKIGISGHGGIQQAGLSLLGLSEGTTSPTQDLAIGKSSDDPDSELAILQQLAGNVNSFIKDLLNVEDSGNFLLGGADSDTLPLQDKGSLEAAITARLTSWKNGTITTDDLIADLQQRDPAATGNSDAISDTVAGFSATLAAGNAGKTFARVDDNSEVNYTALANEQGFRDLLVVTSYFASDALPPIADAYNEPFLSGDTPTAEGAPGANLEEMKDNFYQVLNAMIGTVKDAMDDIQEVRFSLESARADINRFKESHTQERNVLKDIISRVEDANINEVAVNINALQIQMEASFSVTASVQELSLVNFL